MGPGSNVASCTDSLGAGSGSVASNGVSPSGYAAVVPPEPTAPTETRGRPRLRRDDEILDELAHAELITDVTINALRRPEPCA